MKMVLNKYCPFVQLLKIVSFFILLYAYPVSAQDFTLVVDIDTPKVNTQIKLYAVKRYDRMKVLSVDDFITKGIRENDGGSWNLSGVLNDSTSLYRLHIGNYNDESIHSYAQTTTFLSLVKGDSIYLRFPNAVEFFEYEVKNSALNKTMQKVFQVDYKLWTLKDLIKNGNPGQRNRAKEDLKEIKNRKEQILDTISHADAFFYLIEHDIQNHLKNLLYFNKNDRYADKIWNKFSDNLFSKQFKRDISLIKPESSLNTFIYIIFFVLLLLSIGVYLLYKKQSSRFEILSPSERLIIRLIAEGKTNKQIAEEKFTEVSTVKKQVSSVYKKLKVSNRKEAMNYYNKFCK